MPVNTPNNQPLHVAYGQTQGLISVFNPPVISNRAPTVNDRKAIGTLWVNKLLNNAYIETSVVNSQAQWQEIEIGGGGAGNFSSLTVNPGPTNISTVGSGAVTIGNAANTDLISFQVGDGNFQISGNGNTIGIGNDNTPNTILIGNVTSGTKVGITGADGTGIGSSAVYILTAAAGDIQIGATNHTGVIRIGTSTVGETIQIGSSTGADTLVIGNNHAATSLELASGTGGSSISSTGQIQIASSDNAALALDLIADGGANATINIENTLGTLATAIIIDAPVGGVTITGSTSVSINSGTDGNISLDTGAGGAVVSNAPLTANGLYTIADEGGIAGTVGFTNVVSTATGAGTVTFAAFGATNIAQAGWLKFYVNGTAAYIPYFTTIA